MGAIAIAIPLPHHGFSAVILTFHKAIGKARGQKVEEGQNFVSLVFKGREGFAQRLRPKHVDFLYPGIQFRGSSGHCRGGIPGA